MEQDPYRVLGIDRGASEAASHAAYLRCAKACHPDLHPDDPDAEDRFRAIVDAYQAVRADQDRRRDNEELIRRRRAAAEASRPSRSRPGMGAAAGPRRRPRTRQTDGLIVSLLWFLAVMIILAVV